MENLPFNGRCPLKILLVANDIDSETYFSEMAVPMGLCYLASYTGAYLESPAEFRIVKGDEPFNASDYDIVGISSNTFHFQRACQLAEKVKRESQAPVIVGGPHVTALPHRLPSCFDAGVVGEGEEPFLALVKLFREAGSLPAGKLDGIAGIAYHEGGTVKMTPRPPLISPLERIPFPQRELFDLSGKMKQLFSGRGCPCRCHFCATPDSHYRKFPVPYTIKEIFELKHLYHTGGIVFQDDSFTMHKGWVREFVSAFTEAGLHRELSSFINLRADLIDEEMADLLKAMNVRLVYIGIESGSRKVLDYLKNGRISVKQVQRAIDLCVARDMQVEGSFILGSPCESEAELKETFNFIRDNYDEGKLDLVNLFLLVPFPGSALFRETMQRGLVKEEMNWRRLASMPLMQFNPRNYLYLNSEAIERKKFIEYVVHFQRLMHTLNMHGVKRLKENVYGPMGVEGI
ncbi:MAG: radical SAM protein [Candidatus Eremiobacteraeota bacterium]|nr:radical SAM protein [Candidatus Eremiobacteraeota bacterium]